MATLQLDILLDRIAPTSMFRMFGMFVCDFADWANKYEIASNYNFDDSLFSHIMSPNRIWFIKDKIRKVLKDAEFGEDDKVTLAKTLLLEMESVKIIDDYCRVEFDQSSETYACNCKTFKYRRFKSEPFACKHIDDVVAEHPDVVTMKDKDIFKAPSYDITLYWPWHTQWMLVDTSKLRPELQALVNNVNDSIDEYEQHKYCMYHEDDNTLYKKLMKILPKRYSFERIFDEFIH
jgi:hypothetical protein